MIITVKNDVKEHSFSDIVRYVELFARENAFEMKCSQGASEEEVKLLRAILSEFVGTKISIYINNKFYVGFNNLLEVNCADFFKSLVMKGDEIVWN